MRQSRHAITLYVCIRLTGVTLRGVYLRDAHDCRQASEVLLLLKFFFFPFLATGHSEACATQFASSNLIYNWFI